MSRYYIYVYYERYKCKHVARRRLVWSVILQEGPTGAAEIRRKGCVPRARRPQPSTNYINSLYARLLSPAPARVPNHFFDTPHMHFTFLLSFGRAYFVGLLFLSQTYIKCLINICLSSSDSTAPRVALVAMHVKCTAAVENVFIFFRRSQRHSAVIDFLCYPRITTK